MYAIVDIETTGGHAESNGITEIAVFIHDGEKVVNSFETLLKPDRFIPAYISAYTGITNEMVEDAPRFRDIAQQLFELLDGNIFIAHNVGFDYSFIKSHLKSSGIEYNSKKLCTVRLSRKIFPGLRSYSLGNICAAVGITIENRHRASGDAIATVELFEKILAEDQEGIINESLKRGSKEQTLPPNLPRNQFTELPTKPGVYYFHDEHGKIIYVGKAKNIKSRVTSHFGGNSGRKQKQDFFRNIHSISHQICATELMALILESLEIKRYWPEFNRAQKKLEFNFGIYDYEDQNGYIRLCIDRVRKHTKPIETFRNMNEAHNFMQQVVEAFTLCPKLCMLHSATSKCDASCYGACEKKESAIGYNLRVNAAIEDISQKESYAIIGKGMSEDEYSCIIVENEKFYGMGCVPNHIPTSDIEQLKDYIKPQKETFFIRELLNKDKEFANEKIVSLTKLEIVD
jgi:DNA polymerase-3 subunit epsilon